MRFPGYRKFMWVLLVTQMFPVAVLMVPMYQILSELQLIDSYLGLILVYCTTIVPYCAWLMKGYFDTIPFEIDEAGRVDGLTPFGTFARLILPLAKPGLAVAAFYSFLTAFGEVAFASTFMLSDTKYTFAVGLQTFVSEHDAQRNLMAATAVLIAIPVSAVLLPRAEEPGDRPHRGRHEGLSPRLSRDSRRALIARVAAPRCAIRPRCHRSRLRSAAPQ